MNKALRLEYTEKQQEQRFWWRAVSTGVSMSCKWVCDDDWFTCKPALVPDLSDFSDWLLFLDSYSCTGICSSVELVDGARMRLVTFPHSQFLLTAIWLLLVRVIVFFLKAKYLDIHKFRITLRRWWLWPEVLVKKYKMELNWMLLLNPWRASTSYVSVQKLL